MSRAYGVGEGWSGELTLRGEWSVATSYILRRRRWRTGADAAAAPAEDRGRRTSREPAAGVMNRRRDGKRSCSGSRSLRTTGLAPPAGPRRSTLRLEWGEGRRTVTVGLGRGRWRLRRAGSGGPLTEMCRWRSFSPKCRYRTGYNSEGYMTAPVHALPI
jgi:hypothetical protein